MAQLAAGVPSYFGEQRFGYGGDNLPAADQLLVAGKRVKRAMKGIYLSAARAYLFNRVLSERVNQDNWQQPLTGDVLTDSGFPTGPMWGRGRLATSADAAELEQKMMDDWADWCHGFGTSRVKTGAPVIGFGAAGAELGCRSRRGRAQSHLGL